MFLEVTTGPSPETEGYCEQGTHNLDQVWNLKNQNQCFQNGGTRSRRNIGYHWEITFVTERPQEMSFMFGVDFGYGGGVSLDNEMLRFEPNSNIWWGGSQRWRATHLQVMDKLIPAGKHTLYVTGGEGCCDGPAGFFYRVGR